jgi:2-methylisocitrate lyase-like PEP mutase family enzyme
MHGSGAHDRSAAALRALHVPGRPLVAPNAWDALSAQIIERSGFPVVSTSSAAVAASLGFGDGEGAPVEAMLTVAAAVVRSVGVPVTVDFERGYGLAPDELVERLAATGAVGLNLEDSAPSTGALVDVEEQAYFLAQVRSAAASAGVDVVINARTDSFLRQAGSPEEQLVASISRGNRYLAAGADCVYPLGARDPQAIAALVEGIDGPVNIAHDIQGSATIADLAGLGVARVTLGAGLQRHLYAWLESEVLTSLLATPRGTEPGS